MPWEASDLVDDAALARAHSELGAGFARILGYFREDGIKSLSALEEAVRRANAVAMVIPAHTLKGEARQFGAEALAVLAEKIEVHARGCVERHDSPEALIEDVVALRPLLLKTLALLERDVSALQASSLPVTPSVAHPLPPQRGRGGFGRKIG